MKLFTIVKRFDKKQWKRFITYTELYHKPKSVIGKVLAWLDEKSIWIDNNGSYPAVETLQMSIPFSIKQQTLANALATLGNLAEEFLGWQVWQESSNLKRSCQLQALAENSLRDLYLKKQEKDIIINEGKASSIWDEFYKMRSLFNNYYYAISPTNNKYRDEFSELLVSIRRATSTIAQLLLVEVKNREKLLTESWEKQSTFIELLSRDETHVKKIADNLILMNNYGNVNSYKFLMDIIWTEKRLKYSKHIQYSIVAYAENYLLGVIKKGENRAHELLDLYEHSIKNGFYTLNDTITLLKFANIIGAASKLGKEEWARKLVDNWAHKVDQKNIKSIYKLGHALIDFHEKKYDKVIYALSQMKSSNFQHRYRSRWLYLRAQFELNRDYVDAIKTQIDNFRRFIIANRTKINRQTFEGLKTSLRILNMLLDMKDIEQVKEYYTSSKYVFERKWIVEKIKNPA